MITKFSRRTAMSILFAAGVVAGAAAPSYAADKIVLRLATSGSESDIRSISMLEGFAPLVEDFADYKPSYNGTIFAQNTELDAISRGNLEMSIASAQELTQFFPEFSVFAAGYVHQDAAHQVAVFNAPLMDQYKEMAEEQLGIKLLEVFYLGNRHVNLRQSKDELTVTTPADLAGVNLRMPGTDSWQFLGASLGASPTPLAFAEVYTGLSTGAVDGQDNPLPTTVDKKFYEVTKQVVLTSHLVDLNYVVIGKAVWDGLTPEQQDAVQEGLKAAAAINMEKQIEQETSLVSFLESEGLDVYEPDLTAFRAHVQQQYVGSEFAQAWPEGILEQINAVGN